MTEQLIGVIGGSGFIGTWLVDVLLRQDCHVRIIDRDRSERHPELWVAADARDLKVLSDACEGCQVIYNLAAAHRDDIRPVEIYDQVNVLGAQNTCDVADRLGIDRVIFTSSAAVYGVSDGEADETATLSPFNHYGRTKLEAERIFEAWAGGSPARSLTIVRPTVVFGPSNRGNVYLLLQQIAEGRAVVIGNGRNKKSMAYVGNIADFLAHALSFGTGVHIYNYADKPDMDVNTLVAVVNEALHGVRPMRIPYSVGIAAGYICDFLVRLTGHSFPISAVRVRKYAASTRFATERLNETGFIPRHGLQEALICTIRHEFAGAAATARQPEVSLSGTD